LHARRSEVVDAEVGRVERGLVEFVGAEDDVRVIREALKLASLAVLQDDLGGMLAVEVRFGGL